MSFGVVLRVGGLRISLRKTRVGILDKDKGDSDEEPDLDWDLGDGVFYGISGGWVRGFSGAWV